MEMRNTHTLADEIERHAVTHFQSTPSLARMMATDPRSLAALGRLRALLLGGETLPSSLVSLLRPAVTGDIYNMYGPTETTVWSTVYRLGQCVDSAAAIPIGRPLSNTRLCAGCSLRPVHAGEVGELYLGGAGVVRGYWRRPELWPNDFCPIRSRAAGECIARVIALDADGNLEFFGTDRFSSQTTRLSHRVG